MLEKYVFVLRNQKVMLSTHLAKLYGIEVKVLVQAVKRNIERFPDDFMFQISDEEYEILKSQIVTSSWGGIRWQYPKNRESRLVFMPSRWCQFGTSSNMKSMGWGATLGLFGAAGLVQKLTEGHMG